MAGKGPRKPTGVAAKALEGIPGPGRPKGIPNRITRSVKDSLMATYEAIGGDEGLGAWAMENRGEFYKLWTKLLPTKLVGDETGGPVRFSLVISPHGAAPVEPVEVERGG